MRVALFGATVKTGRFLLPRLLDDGHAVTAFGRDAGRLAGLDRRAERRVADLAHPDGLAAALHDLECVISLAHAAHVPSLLAAAPAGARLVLTGSTRKFTVLPDPAADAVRAGERAFLESGRPGVMLHPSMIYGSPGERNVNRLIRLFARWPAALPVVLPLPDGGRHSVQPVFVDDVVAAFAAAVERTQVAGTVILAGPGPITYAAMISTVAAALGRRVAILPVPAAPAMAGARLLARMGLRLPFSEIELRRATEDKAFDVSAMRRLLGVEPRPFDEGIALRLRRHSAVCA